jgi:hypothetical protein
MRKLTEAEIEAWAKGAPDPRIAEHDAALAAHLRGLRDAGVDTAGLRRARLDFILGELRAIGDQAPMIGDILHRSGVTASVARRRS